MPGEFKNFYGPLFLHKHSQLWPNESVKNDLLLANVERNKVVAVQTTLLPNCDDIESVIYSINQGKSFQWLINIAAHMRRFWTNVNLSLNQRSLTNFLSAASLEDVLVMIVMAS